VTFVVFKKYEIVYRLCLTLMPISLTKWIWICFMRVLADIISVNYVGLRHYSTGFAVSDLLPALRVGVPQV